MHKKNLNINKTLITVILLNLIQVISVLGLIFYSLYTGSNDFVANKLDGKSTLFIIIVLTSMINSFFSIKDTLDFANNISEHKVLRNSIEHVENLNKTLRAQRHDFMNHLQVVYSLIELDEYNDAKDYIERIYADIQKVSRILKTSNAAINALLQAKVVDAENRGISVTLKVTTQYKNLPVPSWEMCRILANLIDNSFDALAEIEGEKRLEIELFEDLKTYGFRIKNNGPVITSQNISRIYEAGFTTKAGKGEGMGLAIVKGIVSQYKGSIAVSSDDNATAFEGYIAKSLT